VAKSPASTTEFLVTAAAVRDYVGALGREWIEQASVPAAFASVITYAAVSAMPQKRGVVLTEQQFDFHRPLSIGDRLTTEFVVTEEYERRGRRFMVITTRTSTADQLVVVGRITRMLPLVEQGDVA
jgi:acyl-CoA thioesterase FadM